jgi:hypothetical protein
MMISNRWLLHKTFHSAVLAIFALTTTLFLTQNALATYRPPSDQKAPKGYTDSSGIRGRCDSFGNSSLALLAPSVHVGQTTSSHPTFAWYVASRQKLPVEFTIYKLEPNEQLNLVYRLELYSFPGITKISLPLQKPGLTIGQRYLWQVEVLCNRNRPSHNLVAAAEIETVAIPARLKNMLSHQQDRLQRAKLYAEAGIWYDALGEALAGNNQGKLGLVAASLLQDLASLEKLPQQGISWNLP